MYSVKGDEFEPLSRQRVPANCHHVSWTDDSAFFAVACEAGLAILFNREVISRNKSDDGEA